jgi:hypothetical protein
MSLPGEKRCAAPAFPAAAAVCSGKGAAVYVEPPDISGGWKFGPTMHPASPEQASAAAAAVLIAVIFMPNAPLP